MSTTDPFQVPTTVIWDESFLAYRFNETHPMAPVRLDLTQRLAEQLGVFESANITVVAPPVADDDELATVHTADYITAVRNATTTAAQVFATEEDRTAALADSESVGLGTEDCPVFADLHESAARIAGGTLEAAKAVWHGDTPHAVNFAGGMHHAMAAKAAGFCIYNDAAVAIQWLLDNGAERVAYVDVDAHHGDGVESIFWNDPRVMTISIHESGLMLFPGTGFANEIGGDDAEGTAVNVALPHSVSDAAVLRTVHAVVPQLLREFQPDVLVTQHGADGHRLDPLADLNLSVDGQRQMMLDASDWAADFAKNRWIALGGGGYNPHSVVPRAWTHLLAIAAGNPVPLDTELPQSWREYAAKTLGRDLDEMPTHMNDSVDLWWRNWEVGFDPADPTDQAIMATRKEIFPLHGLDPWFD